MQSKFWRVVDSWMASYRPIIVLGISFLRITIRDHPNLIAYAFTILSATKWERLFVSSVVQRLRTWEKS